MGKQADIVNALSFDLEEWFQAETFATRIYPARWGDMESRSEAQADFVLGVLAEHGVRATFFTLGWLAERRPALVKRIVKAGHELACHGYDHTMITRQCREEFEREIKRSKAILENLCGVEIRGYRAPTFSITKETKWALETLWENRFCYDSSIYPIRHDRYGIPGAPRFPYVAIERDGRALWEFPGPTMRIGGVTLPAAGGGYLRLFPYRWARSAILAAHREGQPANVYAHPWEFDSGLPRMELPFISSLRHYGGIKGNARKIRRLLEEFRFAPMGEVTDDLASARGRL